MEEHPAAAEPTHALVSQIRSLVEILNSVFSWSESDRYAAKCATSVLAGLAKNTDIVRLIIDAGALPALVKHLQSPPVCSESDDGLRPFEHEVEKGSAFALWRFACLDHERQRLIVDAGALPHLVNLLKRHGDRSNSEAVYNVIQWAANAIGNLAYKNRHVQTIVRVEGHGIPVLVELLDCFETEVQKSAAEALLHIAFENDENKNQIVECNALPALILLLRSEDASVHTEALYVIDCLVCSSTKIMKEALWEGALPLIIGLLSSLESQEKAASLLGRFAASVSDCKVHIAQRGAVRPLIEMLQSQDLKRVEMSAFCLASLSTDKHNQAAIAHYGGLVPLLKLLDSENGSIQHRAVDILHDLAENEDNVVDFIKVGGVQKLQDGKFIDQNTEYLVAETLKSLEGKIHGRVLKHLMYLLRVGDMIVKKHVALALAHLSSPEDFWKIFIENINGSELVRAVVGSPNSKQQLDGSMAFSELVPDVVGSSTPTHQGYLGDQYVNNTTLSDVTFLVEGRRFYAHRIALFASSAAFRAMFDGGNRKKDARDIEIPNIKWEVFELMIRFIYTGSITPGLTLDITQDLLKAADQYRLGSLKRYCEHAIAVNMSSDNVSSIYELSEGFNATSLRESCIRFILEHSDIMRDKPGFSQLFPRLIQTLRLYFQKAIKQNVQLSQVCPPLKRIKYLT